MAEGVPPTRWKYYVERQLISLKNRNLRNSKNLQSEGCEQSVFVYRRGLHCHFILFDCIGYLRTSVFRKDVWWRSAPFFLKLLLMRGVSAHLYIYFVAEKRILCLEERKNLFAETVARSSSLRTWRGRQLLGLRRSRVPNAPAWKPDPSGWFFGWRIGSIRRCGKKWKINGVNKC